MAPDEDRLAREKFRSIRMFLDKDKPTHRSDDQIKISSGSGNNSVSGPSTESQKKKKKPNTKEVAFKDLTVDELEAAIAEHRTRKEGYIKSRFNKTNHSAKGQWDEFAAPDGWVLENGQVRNQYLDQAVRMIRKLEFGLSGLDNMQTEDAEDVGNEHFYKEADMAFHATNGWIWNDCGKPSAEGLVQTLRQKVPKGEERDG